MVKEKPNKNVRRKNHELEKEKKNKYFPMGGID